MKQLTSVLVFLMVLLGAARGQQNHFIYIQTENKQPFYVKLDKKIYSSTASGYLIVPKLKEGSYDLAIGFPKSEWTEQNMHCTLESNDAGFLLKNFEDKGWGLFNLQTLAVSMATTGPVPNSVEVVNKTDAFSNMLSNVVNDSTIRQVEVVKAAEKTEPPPVMETQSQATTENVAAHSVTGTGTVQSEIKPGELSQAGVAPPNAVATGAVLVGATREPVNTIDSVGVRSLVTRSKVNQYADGTEMIFLDQSNGVTDTVEVFIPADPMEQHAVADEKAVASGQMGAATKPEAPKEDKTGAFFTYKVTDVSSTSKVPGEAQVPASSAVVLTEQSVKPEVSDPAPAQGGIERAVEKAAPVTVTEQTGGGNAEKTSQGSVQESVPPSADKTAVSGAAEKVGPTQATAKPAAEQVQASPMINSDCKAYASDDDFLKLRKKMVAEDNDDDMILLAKKVFRTRCFSVEQVKNLSVLFLKDASKYSFFDMTYPFVADSHNFNTLQNQLTDPYYINRFLSMIRR